MSELVGYWQRPSLFLSAGCLAIATLVTLATAILQMKDIKTLTGVVNIYEIGERLIGFSCAAALLVVLELRVFLHESFGVRLVNAFLCVIFLLSIVETLLSQSLYESTANSIATDESLELNLNCCGIKQRRNGDCIASDELPDCYQVILEFLKKNAYRDNVALIIVGVSAVITFVCEFHMIKKFIQKNE
ncbi:Uncharacterized protein QTN25_003779 [Entamoeba marina]